jgi:fucose permease
MNIPKNNKRESKPASQPTGKKEETEETETAILALFLLFLLIAMADFLVENISQELQNIFSYLFQ